MALPRTKFQLPALRDDVLERADLVESVRRGATQKRAVFVSAPAGYGKTTLIAQATQRLKGDATVLWLNLDDGDDDIHRFGRALVGALSPLSATWGMAPETLAGLFADEPQAVRDGLNAIINGLYADIGRHVLVMDDFHHLACPEVVDAVEYLLGRLPPCVSFIIASRAPAPAAFGRLHARGLMADVAPDDLRFTDAEASAYLRSRVGGDPADPLVADLLRKCEGWPAGLALLSAARSGRLDAARGTALEAGRREVFDFLAAEVFDSLAGELQSFLLRCCVLHELTPSACAAVSGESRTGHLLDRLRRESCFVGVLDESLPALRLHELFRDFLLHRLSREPVEFVRQLHARAAQAEAAPDRRIQHWCLAGEWDEALRELKDCGPALVLSGEFGTVLRLIAQLPEPVRNGDGRVLLVLGAIARRRWNFSEAAHRFLMAATQFERAGQREDALLASACAIRPLLFLGEIERARELVERCEATTLPHSTEVRSILVSARWWLCLLQPGAAHESRKWFAKELELARSEPIAPVLAHGVWGYVIGLPGAPGFFDELSHYLESSGGGAAPHGLRATSQALKAWSRAWAGNLQEAGIALNEAAEASRLAGSVRAISIELAHLRVLLECAGGNAAHAGQSLALIDELLSSASGTVSVWRHHYRHLAIRASWILGRTEQLQELVAGLAAGDEPQWPFGAGAQELARGYGLLVQERFGEALPALRSAHDAQSRFVMEPFCGDARVPLAYCLARLGDTDSAWTLLDGCLAEFGAAVPGRFLFERKDVMLELLGMKRADPQEQARLARGLQLYRKTFASPAAVSPRPLLRLTELTARELQVMDLLGAGASNKRIAAELFLSLHTVKRHVANIIGKLAVSSRGETAALYRANALQGR